MSIVTHLHSSSFHDHYPNSSQGKCPEQLTHILRLATLTAQLKFDPNRNTLHLFSKFLQHRHVNVSCCPLQHDIRVLWRTGTRHTGLIVHPNMTYGSCCALEHDVRVGENQTDYRSRDTNTAMCHAVHSLKSYLCVARTDTQAEPRKEYNLIFDFSLLLQQACGSTKRQTSEAERQTRPHG